MDYVEIVGGVIGLVYLYLQYRSSVWLWPVSIAMSAFYIAIFYNAKIYADMGLSIYYLVVSVYGWVLWMSKRNKESKIIPITNIKIRQLVNMLVLFIVAYGGIYYALVNFTDSTIPLCDSFTTALSIVGMLMLARKYVEHWIVWVVVDVVSTALYVYKGLYPTAVLYGIYTVVAVFGYFNWRKLMIKESK